MKTTHTTTISSVRSRLIEDGFAVVPELLDSDEIAEIREVCEAYFKYSTTNEMKASDFLRYSRLWNVPFKQRATDALRQVLGPQFMRYPNFTVRFGKYVPWHIDRGFVGTGRALRASNLLCIQSAVHLQDNDDEYGGGLDVLRGSHKILRDCPFDFRLGQDLWSYALAVSGRYPRVRVNAKKGDLVLWDGRLFHRGTPARRPSPVPKLALYWSASSSNRAHASRYLAHLKHKGRKRGVFRARVIERYDEIDSIIYPDSFPRQIVIGLEELGISMATFNTTNPPVT